MWLFSLTYGDRNLQMNLIFELYIYILFGKSYPIEKGYSIIVHTSLLPLSSFFQFHAFMHVKCSSFFNLCSIVFNNFTLCSFFSYIVHLSFMIVNVGVLFQLFSVDYSFKACCCYYFLASHDTSPPTKPSQPSQLFIYTSTFLAPCFSFTLYIVVDICTSCFLFFFICNVFLL